MAPLDPHLKVITKSDHGLLKDKYVFSIVFHKRQFEKALSDEFQNLDSFDLLTLSIESLENFNIKNVMDKPVHKKMAHFLLGDFENG